MNGNSFGAVLSPGGLAGAERSAGERSEPQRSEAAAQVGADPVLASRPDPEVVARPQRRTFTAEYKQRLLTEAEAAAATHPVVLAPCFAAKDCTHRCWPIGGGSGPTASARR